MKELKFKLAHNKDLDKIFLVFKDVITNMNNNDIHQWDEIYPDKNILKEDISKKQLYIGLLEDEIASVYVLNTDCDKQYANGKWEYQHSKFYVIHRLCVNTKFQNNGIGRKTMIHIENELRNKKIDCIRLDSFTLNPFAVRMYEKLGYIKVGIAKWRKGDFYLMEKKL